MRVVCVNNKPITTDVDGIPAWCDDLKEGKIYNAEYVAKSDWGNDCYFISEINALRRVERFRRLDDEWVDELLNKITKSVYEEQVLVNAL